MRRRNAFTLIELLVVIAIIGILAAIIFPVYAQAKKGAYKSSDLSNMNSLRTALQLYKADSGAFPPALLGYVGTYSNVAGGNVLPPNAIKDALYPRRVESLSVFRPALLRVSDNPPAAPYDATAIEAGNNPLVTRAFWPNTNAFYEGTANAEDLRRQRFGTGVLVRRVVNSAVEGCQVVPSYYYRISGYDAAPVSNLAGANMESHYQLFRTAFSVSSDLSRTDACDPAAQVAATGSGADDPRQLGYSDPPETTVVTWNPYFRDYKPDGTPQRTKSDLVLFLAGNARPMDSADVVARGWNILP